MKVILLENVDNMGKSGDVVNASGGFARNYLLPRKLAVLATRKNLAEVEHLRKVAEKRQAKREASAAEVRTKLEGVSLTIARPAGEKDKLYGSVTPKDVEQALREEGISVDKKKVRIETPIRSLGVYTVHVKIGPSNEVPVKLWVVAK